MRQDLLRLNLKLFTLANQKQIEVQGECGESHLPFFYAQKSLHTHFLQNKAQKKHLKNSLKAGAFISSNSMMLGDGVVAAIGVGSDGGLSGKVNNGLSGSTDRTTAYNGGMKSTIDNTHTERVGAQLQAIGGVDLKMTTKAPIAWGEVSARILSEHGAGAVNLALDDAKNGDMTNLRNMINGINNIPQDVQDQSNKKAEGDWATLAVVGAGVVGGTYGLNRKIGNPIGKAYKKIGEEWHQARGHEEGIGKDGKKYWNSTTDFEAKGYTKK